MQRNGYRDRDWESRAGTVELRTRLAREPYRGAQITLAGGTTL